MKKLNLNKVTISTLSNDEMGNVQGGANLYAHITDVEGMDDEKITPICLKLTVKKGIGVVATTGYFILKGGAIAAGAGWWRGFTNRNNIEIFVPPPELNAEFAPLG